MAALSTLSNNEKLIERICVARDEGNFSLDGGHIPHCEQTLTLVRQVVGVYGFVFNRGC